MAIRIGTVRWKLAWALVGGALLGLIGLFAVAGLPAVSAQTDTTAPTISSVAITSGTGDDDSYFDDDGVYGIDDSIKVTVTFSENITVTGAPQLELDIGGSAKAAGYESVTATNVVFSYTVEEGVSDDDGIAISADKLTLNGGSIKDAADNAATCPMLHWPSRGAIKWTGFARPYRPSPSFQVPEETMASTPPEKGSLPQRCSAKT